MRHLRFLLAALAVGAWAAGPLAGPAGAGLLAPTYQSSSPDDGAMMDEAPSEVTVTFSEPLDSSSVMSVFDECGDEVDSGPATVSLNEMSVGIDKTPAGTYKVVYKAVGLAGVTGETAGSFEFMVHDGKPCKGGHGNHPPGHGKGKGGKGPGHGGNHGNGNGNGNHGNHGNGGGDDHDGDHDGGSGMGNHDDDHSSGTNDHSGGTHDSSSIDHDDHDMGSTGSADAGHGKGHGEHGGGPRDEGEDPIATSDNPPVAAGPGGVPVGADAQAMLIGLGLALAVGVLGGWLLRVSGGLAAS